MAASVGGQESRLRLADPAEAQRIGRFAPGRVDPLLASLRKAGQVVDARAADNADDSLWHSTSLMLRRLPISHLCEIGIVEPKLGTPDFGCAVSKHGQKQCALPPFETRLSSRVYPT